MQTVCTNEGLKMFVFSCSYYSSHHHKQIYLRISVNTRCCCPRSSIKLTPRAISVVLWARKWDYWGQVVWRLSGRKHGDQQLYIVHTYQGDSTMWRWQYNMYTRNTICRSQAYDGEKSDSQDAERIERPLKQLGGSGYDLGDFPSTVYI